MCVHAFVRVCLCVKVCRFFVKTVHYRGIFSFNLENFFATISFFVSSFVSSAMPEKIKKQQQKNSNTLAVFSQTVILPSYKVS